MYLLVFCCRYVDLFFTNPLHSALTFYNTIMKIAFLSTSVYSIYLIRKKYHHTYNASDDTFRVLFLIVPSAVLAAIFHMKSTWFEVVIAKTAIDFTSIPELKLFQRRVCLTWFTCSPFFFRFGPFRLFGLSRSSSRQ